MPPDIPPQAAQKLRETSRPTKAAATPKTTSKRPRPLLKRLQRYSQTPQFARLYFALALGLLLGTTILWSWLGASLQAANADQLANAYLFESNDSLRQAVWPPQHTFFMKWPLFYLVKVFAYSPAAFGAVTILLCVATVLLFVLILARLERRSLVLGTVCLAMASVLLMVPPQPYAGGLLPVNMAMLTTRNLEYIAYLVFLLLLIRALKIRSRSFALAVLLLVLLLASDRLFLMFIAGGSLAATLFYAKRRRWQLLNLSANWLIAGLAGFAGAALLLYALNAAHVTQIAGAATASPYTLAVTPKQVVLGAVYAGFSLFTNLGANPAFDATVLREVPAQLFRNLSLPSLLPYAVNLIIAAAGLFLTARYLVQSLLGRQSGQGFQLSILLGWSLVAAVGAFVFSQHQYTVDARYLALAFFTVFVALTVWLSSRKWSAFRFAVIGLVLLVTVTIGSLQALQLQQRQSQALAGMERRNRAAAKISLARGTKTIVGDYWRVLPIKQRYPNLLTAVPMASCSELRDALVSRAWQSGLSHKNFAYLLSFERGLTTFPGCTPAQIIAKFGPPNSSALIAGSLARPKEMLLFYDKGLHRQDGRSGAQAPSLLLPVALGALPHTSCPAPTVMNIVAHQDDDLLFMNPDIAKDITEKKCVRTVYLTAGDAGGGRQYWLSREQGSQAAYGYMASARMNWLQRTVKLPGGQYVTVASLPGNNRLSLMYMHLPDGGLHGQGYTGSHRQSLDELETGSVAQLSAVDGQSTYSHADLTNALVALMQAYRPAYIRTLSSLPGRQYIDHSDHLATSRIVTEAYSQYQAGQYPAHSMTLLRYYLGYPVRELPANLSGEAFEQKQRIFLAYSRYDGSACQTARQCAKTPTYSAYLHRQYALP